MQPTTVHHLIERYDGFLIDAYGVLVDASAALPGARSFLTRLRDARRDFVVVTNDASRTPRQLTDSLQARGIEVDISQVVSSGWLLRPWFASRGLAGARTVVLGPEGSLQNARDAGAQLVGIGEDADVVVIGDEAGYPLLESVDRTASMVIRRVRAGATPLVVVPNPDVVYPKSPGEVGLTSGAIALMLQAAVQAVLGSDAPRCEFLGKPHPPLFQEGLRRLQIDARRAVMIGDQLDTDIRGAIGAGIDAAMVLTGVGVLRSDDVSPTYVLECLG